MEDSYLVIDFWGAENVARMLLLGKLFSTYGINSLIADMTESGRFEMLLVSEAQTKGFTELAGCHYVGASELAVMSEQEVGAELEEKKISVVLRNMCSTPSGTFNMSSLFGRGKLALISVSEDISSLNDSWTGLLRGYERIILVCDGYTGFKPALRRFRKLAKEFRRICSDVSVCTVRGNNPNRKLELQAQYGCEPGINAMTDDGGAVLDLILAYVGEQIRREEG